MNGAFVQMTTENIYYMAIRLQQSFNIMWAIRQKDLQALS